MGSARHLTILIAQTAGRSHRPSDVGCRVQNSEPPARLAASPQLSRFAPEKPNKADRQCLVMVVLHLIGGMRLSASLYAPGAHCSRLL